MKTTTLVLSLLLLGACEPISPAPIARPLPTVSLVPSLPSEASRALEKVKDALAPEAPKTTPELPKVRILSDPRNVLTLTTFTVPQTIRLEGEVSNIGNTGGVQLYQWQVWKLGIPLVSEDQLIQEMQGQLISLTISESGAYRIRLTVTTNHGDKDSASLLLWGRD